MTISAEVTLPWADDEYLFKLGLKQIEELQEKANAGLGLIANRVMAGQFYIQDIYHTIRLGLIGGGLEPVKAKKLVDRYVDGQALTPMEDEHSNFQTAKLILTAAYFGVRDEEEDPVEPAEGKSTPETPDLAGSTSEGSMDKELQPVDGTPSQSEG